MRNLLIFFGLIFISCGSSTPVEQSDTPSNDTGVVTTDSVSSPEEDSVVIDPESSFLEKADGFRKKYLRWYSAIEIRKSILPDRFKSDTVLRFSLQKKMPVNYGEVRDVYPVADLYFYSYTDTSTINNAVNNWLNCFGMDCTPVIRDVDVKSIKTTPSYTIITQKEIIHLQYQCEHVENDWETMIHELDLLFAGKGSTRIRVGCGGPLKWE